MSARVEIRHPGPAASAPFQAATGTGAVRVVQLEAGGTLMQRVSQVMDAEGCGSGVILLDGLRMGPYRFVGPGRSTDGIHAAWYSAPRCGDQARISSGCAIVGRRNGSWWLHAHAIWEEDDNRRLAGHLLPDEVNLPEAQDVTLYAFRGGAFEVSMNAETRFEIFHPIGGRSEGNAVIAKVNPHHDISECILGIASGAGIRSGRVLGVGSLIGAEFTDESPSMESSISEVFVMDGALVSGGDVLLPVFCVDPEGNHFKGPLAPHNSPVCVTFELMLIDEVERPGPTASMC